VTIELPRVVSLSVTEETAAGTTVGDPVDIDSAQTCVIERRDAYALFEDYEPLDEPICVETPAGETALLSGVPAHSDLTITVSKEGFLPSVLSHRVEAQDNRCSRRRSSPFPWRPAYTRS
jgi:hypothetical protein